uniref:uncharacterized protein LOC120345729 n=1 Tax=Styela clava TaxID=7725 RepID=UPI00193977B0|nr:uncharacterized protein LOC120345729 [Styela clava]
MSEKPAKQKIGLLLNHIGDQGIDIFANFTFFAERPNPSGGDVLPAEDRDDYETVIKKFDEYFTKRDPQLMLREKLWLKLNREPDQNFDAWVNAIRLMAQECKFPADFVNEAIRDKLTFSCRDDATKLKLYDAGASLKLKKVIQILSLKEATSRELKETKTAMIDAIEEDERRGQRPMKKFKKYRGRARISTDQSKTKCQYCNYKHHAGKDNCPAAHKKCNKYHKVDHFYSVCQSRIPINVGEIQGPSKPKSDFGGTINRSRKRRKRMKRNFSNDPGWFIKLKAGTENEELVWCIDTGAQVSVMPGNVYKTASGEITVTDKELFGAGGFKLDFECKKGSRENVPSLRTKEDVLRAYPKLFNRLGKLEGEHTIRLKDEAKPFCVTTPRRIPIPLLGKVEAEINCLVKLDVIEAIDEPSEWCAPIVVVPKPSGEIRMCVDLTKLNEAVKREIYTMPTVEHTLGRIAKVSVYTKLDANSGFYQIELDPESRKLTTFITPFGRFMFRRLPYGISSAPELYQKRMNHILEGFSNTTCHMDDIILSTDAVKHDEC